VFDANEARHVVGASLILATHFHGRIEVGPNPLIHAGRIDAPDAAGNAVDMPYLEAMHVQVHLSHHADEPALLLE
jgi:hypothetical protein